MSLAKLPNCFNPRLRAILIDLSKIGDFANFEKVIKKESEYAVSEPRLKTRLPKTATQRLRNYAKETDWITVTANRVTIRFDSEENLTELLSQFSEFLENDDSESE